MKTVNIEKLQRLYRYNPETGEITARASCGRWPADRPLGRLDRKGYVEVTFEGCRHKAHRLAWALMTGELPALQVDHINGRRADNRWENLRVVTHAANQQNRRSASKRSTTGFLGVERNGNMFHARICAHRKRIHLGSFNTAELAHAAYIEAKRRLHEGCTL